MSSQHIRSMNIMTDCSRKLKLKSYMKQSLDILYLPWDQTHNY